MVYTPPLRCIQKARNLYSAGGVEISNPPMVYKKTPKRIQRRDLQEISPISNFPMRGSGPVGGLKVGTANDLLEY